MTTALSEKICSVPEFLKLDWTDADENEYELIEGQIVVKLQGSTSGKHADVVVRLSTALDTFGGVSAGEKRPGKVYAGASTTLGQPEGLNLPKPDVCFVIKGNGPETFDGPLPVAPDLVIEVNSPSDTDERRVAKLRAYQQAGVSLVWSVSLAEEFVIVYSKNKPFPQLFNIEDELDGDEVLPGFRLRVKALFK